MPEDAKPTHALELEGIGKKYFNAVAVQDVSISLQKSEFLTLLGPSGSGKTTTLKIIAGFETPDTGVVRINGRDMTAAAPQDRNLGMVFQHYALFPHMTVAQNIGFPLAMRNTRREEARRRVAEALEMVGMSRFSKRRPAQLSGGQQQRVALARAMVFRPELLLMDEPLGALDKKLRQRLQVEIVKLQKETGITVVFVTHDQDEALMMSDRIAIYRDGKIEQVGSAESLYETPSSTFVADFMGESNIITGVIADRETSTLSSDNADIPIHRNGSKSLVGNAAVVIRPERIRLRAAKPGPGDPNTVALTGTLTQTLYLGNSRRYVVTLPHGQQFTALCPPACSWSDLSVGDEVCVEWYISDSVTVPA